MNGFDEEFDGGRQYGDVDLCARLGRVGVTPICLPGDGKRNIRFNPHGLPSRATYGGAHRDIQEVHRPEGTNLQRAYASKNGRRPYHVTNGGFRIEDPVTPEDIVASYESHRHHDRY